MSTLSLLTEAMDAMIWKKDKEHRYVLANPIHCESFFGFNTSYDCLQYIVGKTDAEMIDLNFYKIGVKNTFGSICFLSDKYVENTKKVTHFFEAGKVDKKEILLYVIKTPQFTNNGEFVGSIGMAWNMTDQSDFLLNQLNRWIYAKKAISLFKDLFSIDSSFVSLESFLLSIDKLIASLLSSLFFNVVESILVFNFEIFSF